MEGKGSSHPGGRRNRPAAPLIGCPSDENGGYDGLASAVPVNQLSVVIALKRDGPPHAEREVYDEKRGVIPRPPQNATAHAEFFLRPRFVIHARVVGSNHPAGSVSCAISDASAERVGRSGQAQVRCPHRSIRITGCTVSDGRTID